ncbi:MAG: DUF115 domain-containing protein [Treponema sp.]|nr:DUF115 domain-containing protein [Treponema sp.]
MGEVVPPALVRGTTPDHAGGARGFSYKGKTLLSGVDPAGRADRIAGAVKITDRTLYLCPSPLYGHGLECLLGRLAQTRNSALLCIEAEPELYAISTASIKSIEGPGESSGMASKDNPKLLVTDRIDAGEICALVRRKWGPRTFSTVRTVRLNGGWQLHSLLYDSLAQTLQKEVALDWGNAITLTRLGRLYIRNAIRNLALLPLQGAPFGGISFGSSPVLVLGAGPSLDGTLDALFARFGGALLEPETRPFRIVCVDTCLPPLKARGIRPDLAVVLESQHWNLEDFVGLSGWQVPVAMDLSALPRSGGVLAGGLCLFFTPWTRLGIFDRLGASGLLPPALPPLGSVGLSAVAMALRLTQGTVVTAGLDFSFTPDMFHSRSSPGHNARLRNQNRFTELLNANTAFGATAFAATSKTGSRVLSTPAPRNYRDLFEREFAAAPDTIPPRPFDIAGNGLNLGIQPLPPETALDLLSPPPLPAAPPRPLPFPGKLPGKSPLPKS